MNIPMNPRKSVAMSMNDGKISGQSGQNARPTRKTASPVTKNTYTRKSVGLNSGNLPNRKTGTK